MDFKKFIRDIPDFPKKGIIFRDITPLLSDGEAFACVIDTICELFSREEIDIVMGAEARGFIFAAPIAKALGIGLVPVRKKGKLPYETISESFELEYGQDSFEIHKDAIKKGQKVLIIDDLLATGGTALAMVNLVNRLGGKVVGIGFAIELLGLEGRKKLEGIRIESLIKY